MTVAKPNKKLAIKPTKAIRKVPSTTFKIEPLHKKALLKLLHCYHSGIALTYSELSLAIKIGEKTKAWQSGAWKDLKSGGFIVMAVEKKTVSGKPKTAYKLSQKGEDLAMSFASDEELEEFKKPITNDEHHEKIRKKLDKDVYKGGKHHKGREIFDLLLKEGDNGITRMELASKMNSKNPEGSPFFYGFNALKTMGLVSEVGKITKEEWLKRRLEMMRNEKETEKIANTDAEFDSKVKKKKSGEATNDQRADSDIKKESDDEKNKDLIKKESGEVDETPKKKKKISDRIRGGLQLFKLSDRAYLMPPNEATRQPEMKNE